VTETVDVAETQKTIPEMEQPRAFELDKNVETDIITAQKPPQSRSWLAPLLIGTGIGIGLAGLGITIINRPNAPKPATAPSELALPPTMTVTIAPAELTPVARTLSVTGTVNARDLIPVLPQATGLQIEQILVDEGYSVKKGQTLAVLDNSVLQTQIDQAKAEVESNRAVVRQKVAALAQARATLAEANSNFDRYRRLADQGAISRQELETRSTTATTAREAISVAQADIASAEADVRSSIASVQQQQTQLNQTIVRAPVSGVIAEQTAQVGDVANSTQKIFSIIQNGSLELQAKVPATNLAQVKIKAPTIVTSDADSRLRLQGNVREIAPLVDPQSREATVKIDLPATALLRPGMFASGAITIANAPGIAIPAKAVLPQSDGSAIAFVLTDGDVVRSQKIVVGDAIGKDNVEIVQGLKIGDRVVVAGAGYLKDGDKVEIVEGK
jgi:HlyD family secretion protein